MRPSITPERMLVEARSAKVINPSEAPPDHTTCRIFDPLDLLAEVSA